MDDGIDSYDQIVVGPGDRFAGDQACEDLLLMGAEPSPSNERRSLPLSMSVPEPVSRLPVNS